MILLEWKKQAIDIANKLLSEHLNEKHHFARFKLPEGLPHPNFPSSISPFLEYKLKDKGWGTWFMNAKLFTPTRIIRIGFGSSCTASLPSNIPNKEHYFKYVIKDYAAQDEIKKVVSLTLKEVGADVVIFAFSK